MKILKWISTEITEKISQRNLAVAQGIIFKTISEAFEMKIKEKKLKKCPEEPLNKLLV